LPYVVADIDALDGDDACLGININFGDCRRVAVSGRGANARAFELTG
jgi:hypothetical protein